MLRIALNLRTQATTVLSNSCFINKQQSLKPLFALSSAVFLVSNLKTKCLFSTSAQIKNSIAANEKVSSSQEDTTRKVEKTRQRFWKEASIKETKDGFNICLDGRVLKTPLGTPLLIPLDRPTFAHLVAGEWETQDKVIKTHALPLTSLVARSIDGLALANERVEVVDTLLKYLDTDSVCYQQDFPQALVELQERHLTPLASWVYENFGVKPHVTCSIIGTRQPQEVREALKNAALKFDPLTLAGFERATIASKSFIIALALMQRSISAEAAAQASHVEITHQMSQWGEVEDTHDVDHQGIRRYLGSSVAASMIE